MLKKYTEKYISPYFKILTGHVIVRYILSGGTAAVTDLSALYLFNSILGVQYLISAILAFLVAFGVSFSMHKFWTFKTEHSQDEVMHKQVMLYLGTSLFGLVLNTLLMYVFVSGFHIQVILSQIFVGLMVACVSFFISRNFVFKYKS